MANQGYFKTWDYVVFISTIVVSFCIGIFYAIVDRRRNTPKDYFLAGGKSHVLPVTFSFVVTFQSSLMVLGLPADVYMYGMRYCYCVLGLIVAYIFSACIFLPVIHPMDITSVYKYFEKRFQSKTLRYLTMSSGAMYSAFYMGTVTYGACVALEVVMGVPYWATIIMYTMITAVYTSLGGIKAVIWSDALQLLIMMTGITAVLIKSTMNAGGMSKVWDVAWDRIDMNDFRFDPTIRYQFWNVFFGGFSQYIFLCFSQSGLQRIKSTPSVKSARQVYVLSALFYSCFITMASFQGATIFALYATSGCDPLASGRLENVNGLVPVAVLDLFHNLPGLAGLFIAALSSAALSTISSCLNSFAAIAYDDILQEKYPNIEEHKATNISKLFVLMFGVLGLILSIVISHIPGTVTVVFTAFMACLDGPTSALFLLALLFRRATAKGLTIGCLCGMAISFWLNMGQMFLPTPPHQMLPAGPTDQCLQNETFTTINMTMSNSNFTENPFLVDFNQNLYTQDNFTGTTVPPVDTVSETEKSALDKLYSVSYMFLSFIGFFVTSVVGVLVSLLTKPPEKIDDRCVFSFKRHVWPGPNDEGDTRKDDMKINSKDEQEQLMSSKV